MNAFDPSPQLREMTSRPGIYRMLDEKGDIIYIGKAKNLKKRVASYFSGSPKAKKVMRMVAQIRSLEVTVTNTETEALLLESNLIKKHRPKYNVLLKDDKSYPFIQVTTEHEFPRILSYRGSRKKKGEYFGPFPSSGAVRETLFHLQKLFRLRKCTDSEFSNRSRPCLQHQIKRCSAPCVGNISKEDYWQDINYAIDFLHGKNSNIRKNLQVKMQQASDTMEYERAAYFRDQVAQLNKIQSQQLMSGFDSDLDCIALHTASGITGLTVMFIRQGRNLGSRSYFPRIAKDTEIDEVLDAFITQYYLHHYPPKEILLSNKLQNKKLIEDAFSEIAKYKVKIKNVVRGKRKQLLHMTQMNAEHAVNQHLNKKTLFEKKFKDLTETLKLDKTPELICCFDISHTMGEATTASCVVFDHGGAKKQAYRRFNIRAQTDGDDYLALQEAVTRYLNRVIKDKLKMPDVMLIDGGLGQVNSVLKAISELDELELPPFSVVGVSKGEELSAVKTY